MSSKANGVLGVLVLVSVALCQASCGPALPDEAVVAGGSGGGGAVASPPAPEAPRGPHRFSPQSHSPVYRAQDAAPVDARSMPQVVWRMRECYGGAPERKAQPIATGGSGALPVKPKAIAKKDSGGAKAAGPRRSKQPASGGAPDDAMYAPAASAPAEPAPSSAPSAQAESLSRESSKSAIAADLDEAEEAPPPRDEPAPLAYDDWGAAIYLSNDDTMSLSSAQRVLYAIDHFLPLPIEHIRPHELLNYFSFDTAPVAQGFDFSVLGGVAPSPTEAGIHSLALSVRGRPVDRQSRRNAALTLVVDRSGSMSDEGRMDFLKQGLRTMLTQLKNGDVINVVLFDHEVCAPVEGFVVGRDSMSELQRAIDSLAPRGATDLHLGLTRGYDLADRLFQASHTNRVLLITDALTNTGVTDEELISTASRYYDSRRIRLSGIGVGREFNDTLLDRLTERGKGAYVFLGSQAEVDAVFGSHFLSLIETTAVDVRFRLHLPPSLRMQVFYGEESSTVKEDVQEIHYFANTSQLFLSDLQARDGSLRLDDEIMLSIEYKDPETEAPLVEQVAMPLGELAKEARNVAKGRLIMAWIDLVAQIAARQPESSQAMAGGWIDPEAYGQCEQGTAELERLSNGLSSDPEARRVLELWRKYCSRFERPREPVRRQIATPPDAWPGAR